MIRLYQQRNTNTITYWPDHDLTAYSNSIVDTRQSYSTYQSTGDRDVRKGWRQQLAQHEQHGLA